MKKVSVISLGCAKNRVDSEIIAAKLAMKGYVITFPEDSTLVILNTCAFIKDAVYESQQWIEKLIKERKKVVVVGCLVERFKEKIKEIYPEVKQVVGIDGFYNIEKIVSSEDSFYSDSKEWLPLSHMPRIISTPGAYSYVKIAEGCSNHCAYCTIPLIRGELRSRRIEDIIKEVNILAQNGIKEIIIIAHDPTSYGIDLYGKSKLTELLLKIEKIKNLKWIRVMYLYPTGVEKKLVETIKNSEKILNYIDIPIQHASNKILKRMGRRYNSDYLKRVIETLKENNFVIRTTVMVGFPGEKEKDFEELEDFLKWAEFDHLGIFRYSDEPETLSFKMKEKVPEKIKEEREKRLMLLQKEIVLKKAQSLEGREVEGVVDYSDSQSSYGRTWQDAPEVDRKVVFRKIIAPGKFIKFKIKKIEEEKIYADTSSLWS